MSDPYPLRPLHEHEITDWARMTCDTYGTDWREGGLRGVQGSIEPERTVAAFDGDRIIGGGAIYSRDLTVPGAVRPVAGVTLIAVSPTHRRRGVLTSIIRRQFEDVRAHGESVAALNASEGGIYGRFGYGMASRLARVSGDKRMMRLHPGVDTGQGRVQLLDSAQARPLLEKVHDTVRSGSVGWVDRPERFWDALLRDDPPVRGGMTAMRFAVHTEPGGEATGYAIYRFRGADDSRGTPATVHVVELAATRPRAHAALWDLLISIDAHPGLYYEGPVDDPLPRMLTDAGALSTGVFDNLWVRLVDVERALAERHYSLPLDVVLEVDDAFCPWNTGRYRLRADGEDVRCERTGATADLRLSAAELGAAYLGGTTLASLAQAGRVTELTPGSLSRCSTAFRGEREPFHPSGRAFPAY
ncbi:GNAT family N-acetyltransferase [Nocardiopsis exhalans]|uniref:GNAT family N-acetyltransferase n=1 Tax=Nocardiopsis exhalans TaxID=163604 RepID=A0ABY5DFP0_9ACTN|nr:GNAT family N-acetyltransferase [Nocardiopsis exhalans]USY22194.1 GNAT family N-acetyltransferase [Nocardiopsis exhalans]